MALRDILAIFLIFFAFVVLVLGFKHEAPSEQPPITTPSDAKDKPRLGDTCILCNKPNAHLCNRCKCTCYCSKECQKADWPVHKLLCSTFANFASFRRPTSKHVRAIHFSVDGKKPQFIWIHDPSRGEYDSKCPSPNIEPVFGPSPPLQLMAIHRNPVLNRTLIQGIDIYYRDTFLVDGSKPNKSIAAITDAKPGYSHEWRGPMLAFGNRPAAGLFAEPDLRDIDMNDLRHIADHFLSYGEDLPRASPPPPPPPKVQIIKGVRINCLGDTKLLNKAPFEAVDVPSTDLIFALNDSSDIADRIGFPILTRRLPPDPEWKKHGDGEVFENETLVNNQNATFLHQCCDPNATSWGWVYMPWQPPSGSVLVVRPDKKPLHPWHVEALSKYCRYEILPLMGHSLGEYAPDEPMKKELVLSMICRATFVIFWYKMLNEKIKEKSHEHVPFPYDIK